MRGERRACLHDDSLQQINDVSGSVRFSTQEIREVGDASDEHSDDGSNYMDLADELPAAGQEQLFQLRQAALMISNVSAQRQSQILKDKYLAATTTLPISEEESKESQPTAPREN